MRREIQGPSLGEWRDLVGVGVRASFLQSRTTHSSCALNSSKVVVRIWEEAGDGDFKVKPLASHLALALAVSLSARVSELNPRLIPPDEHLCP